MSLAVIVKGGTNAGRRIIRQPAVAWTHVCVVQKPIHNAATVTLDAAFRRCPACGAGRPS